MKSTIKNLKSIYYNSEFSNSNFFYDILSIGINKKDLNILITLLNNPSKIRINPYNDQLKNLTNSWISPPNSLGDLVIISILEIIEKNIDFIENITKIHNNDTESSTNKFNDDSSCFYYIEDENNKNAFLKPEKIITDIIENNLINKLFWLLINGSDTKKDSSIIILIKLTKNKILKKSMTSKSTIKLLINHIIGFKLLSNLDLN